MTTPLHQSSLSLTHIHTLFFLNLIIDFFFFFGQQESANTSQLRVTQWACLATSLLANGMRHTYRWSCGIARGTWATRFTPSMLATHLPHRVTKSLASWTDGHEWTSLHGRQCSSWTQWRLRMLATTAVGSITAKIEHNSFSYISTCPVSGKQLGDKCKRFKD